MRAMQCFVQSIRILQNSHAYNILSLCYRILENKISAIECDKQAIIIDYGRLPSYLHLSSISQ
jgi:hypothetical protein